MRTGFAGNLDSPALSNRIAAAPAALTCARCTATGNIGEHYLAGNQQYPRRGYAGKPGAADTAPSFTTPAEV